MSLYCVTFRSHGQLWYAVRGRGFQYRAPEGIAEPERRCAMPKDKAKELYNFIRTESTFKDVCLHELKLG